jgi:glycosyltransferase involved in cell wall biosynthesis
MDSPPRFLCQSVNSALGVIGQLQVEYAGFRPLLPLESTVDVEGKTVPPTLGSTVRNPLEVRWKTMACSIDCFSSNTARPATYFKLVEKQCHCLDIDFNVLGEHSFEAQGGSMDGNAFEILHDFQWHSAEIAKMRGCKGSLNSWDEEDSNTAHLRAAAACGFYNAGGNASTGVWTCFCSAILPSGGERTNAVSAGTTDLPRPLAPWNVSLGLWNDALLLEHLLPGGRISVVDFYRVPYIQFENATLYLESLDGFTQVPFEPHLTLFMPNHEWLKAQDLDKIEYVDYVLCKTELCLSIFTTLKKKRSFRMHVIFTSFTSIDQQQTHTLKDYSRLLHLAGKSPLKQTDVVLTTWLSHSEWPHLTVLCHRDCLQLLDESNVDLDRISKAANIHLITKRISDEEVSQLMNSIGVHLCPSSVESFGHYANEARSASSLVVATNAPPLCEFFVDGENGIGIEANVHHAFDLNGFQAETFRIRQLDLEAAIEKVINLPIKEREKMAKTGRQQYESHRFRFYDTIAIISNLLRQHPNTRNSRVVEVHT